MEGLDKQEKGSFRDGRASSTNAAESGSMHRSIGPERRNRLTLTSQGEMETSRETNGVFKEIGKINPRQRSSSMILVLALIIIFGFLGLLIQSPKAIAKERPPNYYGHSTLHVKHSEDLHQTSESTSYPSIFEIQWSQVSTVVRSLTKTTRLQRLGLLNFNTTEVEQWRRISNNVQIFTIQLPRASINITWETLFPEWIDQDEEHGVPSCPHLPYPQIPKGVNLDLVAVKLPCHKLREGWARDIRRLHLQLAAARAAAYRSGNRMAAHVLLLSECFPLPNLFRLEELVDKQGSAWLYKTTVEALREKIHLPVGSCALAVPRKSTGRPRSKSNRREAYATILHSAPKYICGAIVAARSIRMTGSTRELVVLVDRTIGARDRHALASAGWLVRVIDRIRNPKSKRDAYNEFNYSKLRLWQLTEYDAVVFLDADVLVLRNIDFLFAYPEITATGNDRWLFNSGVMVVEPSNATFGFMMDRIHEIDSYNGGDQGFLNEVFAWWHRMGRGVNFLKYFGCGRRQKKESLLGEAYVVHYLGMKPWWCYRDYDCNWNMGPSLRNFASDVANDEWWKIYDTMPKHLKGFCSLRTKQKAALEWHRRNAEKANYTDGHWRLRVKDVRQRACMEKDCDWKRMLRRWDKKEDGAKVNISSA